MFQVSNALELNGRPVVKITCMFIAYCFHACNICLLCFITPVYYALLNLSIVLY